MKYYFKLLATLVLTNIGATFEYFSPSFRDLPLHVNRLALFPLEKRNFEKNTLEEDSHYNLSYHVDEMRGFVHEDHINFASFSKRGEQILKDVIHTQLWAPRHIRTERWFDQVQYVRSLFDGITEAMNLSGRFKGCNYYGSDLVEDMAALHVRILSLNEGPDASRNFEYYQRKAAYNHRFAVLFDRAKRDPEMSAGMKGLFNRQVDLVKTSYQRMNEADGGSQVNVEFNTCPII